MKMVSNSGKRWYTTAMLGLFAAGFIFIVLFGVRVYLGAVSVQGENDDLRAVMSYISTAVKSHDSENAVIAFEGPYGDTLCLKEDGDSGVYERRIYLYDGYVVEEYSMENAEYDHTKAQIIGRASEFEITEFDKNLLQVSTNNGKTLLHLHSGEDG